MTFYAQSGVFNTKSVVPAGTPALIAIDLSSVLASHSSYSIWKNKETMLRTDSLPQNALERKAIETIDNAMEFRTSRKGNFFIMIAQGGTVSPALWRKQRHDILNLGNANLIDIKPETGLSRAIYQTVMEKIRDKTYWNVAFYPHTNRGHFSEKLMEQINITRNKTGYILIKGYDELTVDMLLFNGVGNTFIEFKPRRHLSISEVRNKIIGDLTLNSGLITQAPDSPVLLDLVRDFVFLIGIFRETFGAALMMNFDKGADDNWTTQNLSADTVEKIYNDLIRAYRSRILHLEDNMIWHLDMSGDSGVGVWRRYCEGEDEAVALITTIMKDEKFLPSLQNNFSHDNKLFASILVPPSVVDESLFPEDSEMRTFIDITKEGEAATSYKSIFLKLAYRARYLSRLNLASSWIDTSKVPISLSMMREIEFNARYKTDVASVADAIRNNVARHIEDISFVYEYLLYTCMPLKREGALPEWLYSLIEPSARIPITAYFPKKTNVPILAAYKTISQAFRANLPREVIDIDVEQPIFVYVVDEPLSKKKVVKETPRQMRPSIAWRDRLRSKILAALGQIE